jgi:hypothetical protein
MKKRPIQFPESVRIRLSTSEAAWVRRTAKKGHITVSQYFRIMLADEMGKKA